MSKLGDILNAIVDRLPSTSETAHDDLRESIADLDNGKETTDATEETASDLSSPDGPEPGTEAGTTTDAGSAAAGTGAEGEPAA